VEYDPGKGEIFVANHATQSVFVINDSTNKVITSVPLRATPDTLTYVPAKGEVYVVDSGVGGGTVSIISDSTNSVVGTLPVGNDPDGSTYDSALGLLLVSSGAENLVQAIPVSANAVEGSTKVGAFPGGIAYDSGKGESFVANLIGATVSVIADSQIVLTSATSSSVTTSVQPTTTVTSSSSVTTQSSSSSSGSGGGGVPEFPYQLVEAALFTLLLAGAYLFVRSRNRSRGGFLQPAPG